MCVIALIEEVRPSDEQIGQMWDQNPKGGGGAAWRETVDGVRLVRWEKGLDKEEMLALNRKLPLPYILHFRQPSHDTSDSLLACHPFQIDEDATTAFNGTTTGWVLFHNGFWTDWRRKLEALALAGFKKLPSGAWSDSRGLAWVAHHLGFGILEMINEKVLCFGPEDLDVEMFGTPWLAVKGPDTDKTIIVSNRTWERTTIIHDHRNSTSRLLAAGQQAVTGKAGGTSQETAFPCSDGRVADAAGAEADQQKQVQEGHQGAVPEVVGGGTEGRSCTLMNGVRRPCTKCNKLTPVGMVLLEQWFCFQCWALNQRETRSSEQSSSSGMWVGECGRCKVGLSGMKTVLGDEWICHACWETNGRPRIYSRAVNQAKSAA